jgi:hypothetical protein
VTTFRDIEADLVAWLTPTAAVETVTEVPATRPAEFVRCWVTGGSAQQRVLDRPTVTVQSWAATSPAASAIATRCRDAFLARYGAAAEITRPYFDPDPDTGIPRYTFSFRVRNRATN